MFDRLPNFMILGVAKAGTTSLHAYLQQHPAFFMSTLKEPHFFDQRDDDYLRNLDVYLRKYFTGAEAYPLRGEATPSYFTLPELVAPRLRNLYEDRPLKFVVGLRDPVARAWSHYVHRIGSGEERETFARALELEAERLAQPKPSWAGYFQDGLYARHLKAWLNYFDLDRFTFFLLDDLHSRGNETVAEIVKFLGADPSIPIDTSRVLNPASRMPNRFLQKVTRNSSRPMHLFARLLFGNHDGMYKFRLWMREHFHRTYTTPPQMDAAIERDLRQRYADDVKELSKLLGRDLSSWLPPASTPAPTTSSPRDGEVSVA